jgi:hypothetical protein
LDVSVILKYMCIVPKKSMEMARSIDNLLNLNTMSIEELTSRLRVYEDDIGDEQNGLCE